MGMQKYRGGFTIIEVMLFLAVSGALAIGILGSSAIGINNQRYVDAVNSFKALIQEEFVNTTQVINSRQANAACELDPANDKPVGASECIIMGRLMSVGSAGEITRSNLIGFVSDTGGVPTDDIAAIKHYTPTIDTTNLATSTMNWGTHLKDQQAISIVIFRSPSSGNVLSFVHTGSVISTQSQLRDFMDNTSEFTNTTARTVCIAPAGLTIAQVQAVQIAAYAAGPSAVEQVAGAPSCA